VREWFTSRDDARLGAPVTAHDRSQGSEPLAHGIIPEDVLPQRQGRQQFGIASDYSDPAGEKGTAYVVTCSFVWNCLSRNKCTIVQNVIRERVVSRLYIMWLSTDCPLCKNTANYFDIAISGY